MKLLSDRLFVMCGLAVFIAGVIISLFSAVSMLGLRDNIERSRMLLSKAEVLRGKLGLLQSAERELSSEEYVSPQDMDSFLVNSGLKARVSASEKDVSNIGTNWSLLSHSLSFNDVLLSELDSLVAECAAANPPWVLASVALHSSPFESGRVRAEVKMQAIRRKSH